MRAPIALRPAPGPRPALFLWLTAHPSPPLLRTWLLQILDWAFGEAAGAGAGGCVGTGISASLMRARHYALPAAVGPAGPPPLSLQPAAHADGEEWGGSDCGIVGYTVSKMCVGQGGAEGGEWRARPLLPPLLLCWFGSHGVPTTCQHQAAHTAAACMRQKWQPPFHSPGPHALRTPPPCSMARPRAAVAQLRGVQGLLRQDAGQWRERGHVRGCGAAGHEGWAWQGGTQHNPPRRQRAAFKQRSRAPGQRSDGLPSPISLLPPQVRKDGHLLKRPSTWQELADPHSRLGWQPIGACRPTLLASTCICRGSVGTGPSVHPCLCCTMPLAYCSLS